MDDDLNVAEALAALYGFMRTINTLIDSGGLSRPGRDAVVEALRRVDSVLGVMQPDEVSTGLGPRREHDTRARGGKAETGLQAGG